MDMLEVLVNFRGVVDDVGNVLATYFVLDQIVGAIRTNVLLFVVVAGYVVYRHLIQRPRRLNRWKKYVCGLIASAVLRFGESDDDDERADERARAPPPPGRRMAVPVLIDESVYAPGAPVSPPPDCCSRRGSRRGSRVRSPRAGRGSPSPRSPRSPASDSPSSTGSAYPAFHGDSGTPEFERPPPAADRWSPDARWSPAQETFVMATRQLMSPLLANERYSLGIDLLRGSLTVVSTIMPDPPTPSGKPDSKSWLSSVVDILDEVCT
ncbi:uncharacterized protein V1510DRAFT_441300 [Dipodascopsis tothii]|uniref:uncharacterized protein n=1 Tax=Dipodascopsis tothii TaxID=44089 RepID=UPI0034CF9CBE